MKNLEFIGWVPCLTGSLYFENTYSHVIGNGYLNEKNVELNKITNEIYRYTVVASNVNWKDFDADADGDWNVILLASGALDANFIEGKVFLIPAQNPIWHSQILGSLKNIAKRVHEKSDIQIELSELETVLINSKQINPVYIANFQLKKSGIVYLSYETEQQIEGNKSNINLLICRQCFYYLKYTFHKHKHHALAESLTTIHPYSSEKDVVGEALISDLRKALVTLSRDCDPSDYKVLFSSKGVLSYTKSLALTCKLEGLITDSTYASQKIYLDNIGESLEITGKKIEGGINTRIAFNANFRSICIFAFALLAPLTLLYKDNIVNSFGKAYSTHHIVKSFAWVVGDERHMLTIILIVLMIYYILRWINIRYGSPILALLKFKKISNEKLEFVLENKRSAEVLFAFLIFMTVVLILTGMIRLL